MVRFDQPYINGVGLINDYVTTLDEVSDVPDVSFITGISAETFGFSNNLDICNNLMVHGHAEISGNTNIYGTLDVSSNAIFKNSIDICNNLSIHNSLDISNNLDVSGSTVIDGNLTVKTTINDGIHNVYDEAAVSFGDSPDFYIINDFLYNSISENDISSTDLSSVGLILTKDSFGIADSENIGGKSLAGTLFIKDKWYINTTFQHDGSGGIIFSNSMTQGASADSQVSAFITSLAADNQLKIAWFNNPASSELSGIMKCNPEPYMYNLEIIKEESPNNTDPSYITVNLNEISNNIIINSEKKVISLNPELGLDTTFNIHLGLPNEISGNFDNANCAITEDDNYKLTVSKFIFANNSDFNPTPSLVTRGNCITANKIIARDSLHVLDNARFHKNITINQDCTVIGTLRTKETITKINTDISGNLEVDDYLKIYGDVSSNGYVLDVSGNSYFRNNVDISGDTHLDGILDVSGNSYFRNNVDISGDIILIKGSDISMNGGKIIIQSNDVGFGLQLNTTTVNKGGNNDKIVIGHENTEECAFNCGKVVFKKDVSFNDLVKIPVLKLEGEDFVAKATQSNLGGVKLGADSSSTDTQDYPVVLNSSDQMYVHVDWENTDYILPPDVQFQPSEGAFDNGDKTKLDGIDSGAQVTNSAQVSAAGAVMLANSGQTNGGSGGGGTNRNHCTIVLLEEFQVPVPGGGGTTLTSRTSTIAPRYSSFGVGTNYELFQHDATESSDTEHEKWYIRAAAGVGSTNPRRIKVEGTDSSWSDDRLKHNESNIENALTTINKLKPQTYIMTEEFYDANHNLDLSNLPNDAFINSGYIAQEVLEIHELKHLVTADSYMKDNSGNRLRDASLNFIPNLYKRSYVTGEYRTYSLDSSGNKVIDPSGTLHKELPIGINYDGMQPYLTKAIQELHGLVLEQSATISTLQSQNSALEARLSALENN